MEFLGKTALLVIEPFDFDLRRQKVFYPNFGFVLTSESEFFRNIAVEFIQKYHTVRQKSFGPKVLTGVKKSMKAYLSRPVKTEREFLGLLAIFFDIVYYTSNTRDLETHLRRFHTFDDTSMKYYLYVGTLDITSLEILDKIQEKSESLNLNAESISSFEIVQVLN